MLELQYPFDCNLILKKKKSLKRRLLESNDKFIEKRIAVLGGSTTHDVVAVMELFLLDNGIKPQFYECEYAQYWEDVMFNNPQLIEFKPDIIYFHTTNRNIRQYPELSMTEVDVEKLINSDFQHFEKMWGKVKNTYNCPIIQNNFEYPFYRLLGNADVYNIHGRVNYISRLNERFNEYARSNKDFYIHDINYLSSSYGLDRWSDNHYWHMYKYALSMEAIPLLAHSVSNIIKSIYGKNKKGIVLDLDNTLWGGVIGDDGVENIEIGQETPTGQVYSEFQNYIKEQKALGVILNISSKNEYENAVAGLLRPDSVLTPDDFISIKANWEPKSNNIALIARELNLLPESLVFIDDNPAEREIVSSMLSVVSPDIGSAEDYIRIIDHSGFFEVTNFSLDDAKRNDMYKENSKRLEFEANFDDYGEYLKSLNMKARIKEFESIYMDRIAQLSNKSNQFNLTTRRYTRAEIEEIAKSDKYIDIYGKLEDRFGDNGVVSVVIGHKLGETLNIDLWIMSCRVLKRDMEYAMMDDLVKRARSEKIRHIKGYYYPTAKNKMVKEFYGSLGFDRISEDEEGNSVWDFEITSSYETKNQYIDCAEDN